MFTNKEDILQSTTEVVSTVLIVSREVFFFHLIISKIAYF